MEHAPVGWTKRFDDGVLRSRLTSRLQLLLQSSLWVGRGRGDRISRAQLWAERQLDKVFRRLQPAIQKDRPSYGLEDIRQQSVLAPAAALLFPAPKPHEFAQPQISRRLCQGGLADQSMLHARQFAF